MLVVLAALKDDHVARLGLIEGQRNAFVWNELDGETFQSIADRTGEGIKTWISRKRYATRFLRQQLADLYDDLQHY